MGKPVDIYVRVSRVGPRTHLISPDEQRRRAEQLATEQGLVIGKVLQDIDESGGKWERPGLQEALTRVKAGQSGGLIVAWLDRLTRDSEHAARLVREINEHGGKIYAPDAPSDLTTPEGTLHLGIFFAFAQYTRERAKEGFARAQERAIMNGIPIANRPPVGYRKGPTRRLEPDPEVAPVIAEFFRRRADGAGPTALGEFLEEHGVRTSQGSSTWSKPAVMTVVRNRVYLGELAWGKKGRAGGPIVNAAAHLPIVDRVIWEAAQRPAPRPLPHREGGYMLTGVLRCAACGYSMQGTRTSRGVRIYRCIRRHAGGECPNPGRVIAETVEETATRLFLDTVRELQARGEPREADLTDLEDAVKRARQQFEQVQTRKAQATFGAAWFDMADDRARQLREAEEALAEARVDSGATAERIEYRKLRKLWPELAMADRRELVAAQFDALALSRESDGYTLAAWPRGTGPTGLSRRGFNRRASLHPLDIPDTARVVALQDAPPRRRDGGS